MKTTLFRSRTRPLLLLTALALLAAACGSDGSDDVGFDSPPGTASVVPATDIEFTEISPFARFGPAQGDFTASEHGTFGIFGEGAASPPHTHSGAYYAVVLEGEMSNPFGTEPDPAALGPGSFWAVPADAQHVTACLTDDEECLFFFHAASAFDFNQIDDLTEDRAGEAASMPVDTFTFEELEPFNGATTVWGDRDTGRHGTILRLAAGSSTGEHAQRAGFTLVPMTGALSIDSGDGPVDVGPGSLVEVEPNTVQTLGCDQALDCVFYIFSDAAMEISR